MKSHFPQPLVALLCACILCATSCNKDNKLETSDVMSFRNIDVSDVCIIGDSVVIVCGSAVREGRIIKQRQGFRAYTNAITHTFDYPINSLYFNDTVIWACGDNMLVLKSTDYGTTWTQPYDFNYFWEYDRSNLTKIYATNDFPTFAIGARELFNGHIYVKSPSIGISQNEYPFLHRTPKTDVYDFTAISNSEFFVAGYGSIFRYINHGQTVELERIGGEIFSGITSVGNDVITCSFSGNIFTRNILDENKEWNNVFKTNKNLRHIAATTNGYVLCIGDNNNSIFTSSNKGIDWNMRRFRGANSVVAVKVANNKFYVAQKNGQIVSIDPTTQF
ncbi:MAG: hypothetical protein FWC39_08455 [Bacteroidetes bacterium]|nr:hypothetical protein [Bacteroidota bacterium]